jgi:hypothetical protein
VGDDVSRRPELHDAIATAEQHVLDKDLEDMHDFLSSISHLQVDDVILHEIRSMYALNITYSNNTLPTGVHFDSFNNLCWMTDKVCLPNDIAFRDIILNERHNNAGHPDPNSTLLNVSKMFWWPRMRKIVTHFCRACTTCQSVKVQTT